MENEATQNINITEIILDTANSIFNSFLESVDKNIYPLLDKVIFVDKGVTEDTFFERIFGTSPTSGILMLSNCLLFAFILYYCVRLITSHFSGTETESPSKFFIRIILAATAMNASLEICKFIIDGAYQISTFFISLGEQTLKNEISFTSLNSFLNNSSNKYNIFSLGGIVSGMLSFSSLTLLVNFALRYILIKLLVLAAPFAFLCLSTKTTEPFFKSWYRSFISLLFIQILISVLLIIPHALMQDNSDPTLNQLLLIGSISALLKADQLVREFFGGIGIGANFQAGISGIKSMMSR